VIELRGICKRYDTGSGRPVMAADDVSLTIEAAEFVGLTGASGAGKTTLLNLMGAIDRPDAGTVRRDGTDVTALRGAAADRYRRTVGLVFQRCALLPALTAVDETVTEPSDAAVANYLHTLGPLDYPVALDKSGRVADGYAVQDQPWLVLVNAAGKITWQHDGWVPVAALEKAAAAHP